MNYFPYHNNELHCEEVPLSKIGGEVGTPVYVYSFNFLVDQFHSFDSAFKGTDHLICYSMKANSNGALLRIFIKKGAGIDVVSGGELSRALKAGCDPQKIVYSGVGKTEEEMKFALEKGILQFNVEAVEELTLLNQVALQMGKKAPIALRVNPDVDPETHAYIATGLKESKFGISRPKAFELYRKGARMKGIQIVGIDCHIGSQLTRLSPIEEAVQKVMEMVEILEADGILLSHIDLGGGLGIVYKDETPPTPEEYASAIRRIMGNRSVKLILEPGRFLVGNSGVLLTRVLFNKERENKRFVVVDGASNDLMRPALYDAWHRIQAVCHDPDRPTIKADVVGPVCETGDFLALDRELPRFESGELMALMSAGAYGYSMGSNYNSRPRPAEVLVKGKEFFVINEREKIGDLTGREKIPEFLI